MMHTAHCRTRPSWIAGLGVVNHYNCAGHTWENARFLPSNITSNTDKPHRVSQSIICILQINHCDASPSVMKLICIDVRQVKWDEKKCRTTPAHPDEFKTTSCPWIDHRCWIYHRNISVWNIWDVPPHWVNRNVIRGILSWHFQLAFSLIWLFNQYEQVVCDVWLMFVTN